MPAWMGAEDFSRYRCDVDEVTLRVGVRAMAGLAWDYLAAARAW
jgi:hypothetical protein